LEKRSKWVKLKKEFSRDDSQVSDAFLLPVRIANEPYLHSFRYKVLNSVLFTNDRLCKIGYISNPNCTLCHQLTEIISHILFSCSLSNSFWHKVNGKILSKIESCRGLSLTYCDVIVGSFEVMDLFSYIVILGKPFLWTCRCKETLPSLGHFIRILLIKYKTEKHIFQIGWKRICLKKNGRFLKKQF